MAKKAHSKNALIFVLITVMINSIGFGIIIPVLPDLLVELTSLSLNEAAIHGGRLTFVFALMQFISMPIVGALSDRFGRRPIMLLSLFGLALDYFLMGFAPTIALLYLGRIIAGGLGATFSTANAYIADITPPETRAQNFGLVGAAFGVGFMIGPAIGGVLGDVNGIFGAYASPRLPFIAAGVISLMNVVYGFIFLPETLSEENRREFKWSRANPFGALKSLGRVTGVKSLIFVLFVLAVAHTAYPSAYAFSTMEKLDWDSGDVGVSLFAFGMASMIVQGGLIRIIIPKIGLFWAGVMGMVSASIAYTGIGLANAGWVVYAMGPFAAFAGLYNPALSNMMSSRISASEQGELQGAIGAAQGLALMIGPLAMTMSFNYFAKPRPSDIPYYPGAPFYLAGALAVIALITYMFVTTKEDRKVKMPRKEEEVLD